jgi:RNA polymerase sigma factor (sigma-70 family)
MPSSPATTVLHFLRRLIAVRDVDATSDSELLKRFARTRDEAAFAELLRRHGPMVLGVCRRLLGDSADADDAFQATFLVLVRKAGALGAPESVANWLHGVAHRTALKARVEAAKRRQREREGAAMLATSASDDVIWRDLRPVLDEEIQRLPARYRAPFVACHLEGMTNAEAARQLGCPEGTVQSRLSRARERLRARLTKRGVTLSTTALAALVTEQAASATVAAALSTTTLKAALSLGINGAATGIISTHVLALAEGVLQAMYVTKVKIVVTLVLAVGLLAGAGAAGYSALTQEPVQDQKPETERPKIRRKGADDFEERRAAIELNRKLQPLMEKRLDAVREQMKARAEELIAGKTTVDVLLGSSANLLKAQQEMSDKPVDQLKALELHFGRMKAAQEILETRFEAGKANTAEVCQAKYFRYDAEIALERYKSKLGPDRAKGEATKAIFEGTDWKEIVEGLQKLP